MATRPPGIPCTIEGREDVYWGPILVSAIQIKLNVSFLTSFSLFLVEMNVKSYETIYQSTLKHEGTW